MPSGWVLVNFLQSHQVSFGMILRRSASYYAPVKAMRVTEQACVRQGKTKRVHRLSRTRTCVLGISAYPDPCSTPSLYKMDSAWIFPSATHANRSQEHGVCECVSTQGWQGRNAEVRRRYAAGAVLLVVSSFLNNRCSGLVVTTLYIAAVQH